LTISNSSSSDDLWDPNGDINEDRKIDMKDISRVAAGFQTRPSDTKWTANGDLDENGVINMKDISTTAKEFGKTT
jgi:hypothetical protein